MARDRGPMGPPCPGCGQTGRRNQSGRADKKYRCVNMSCDWLFYSWVESVDAERARLGVAEIPQPSSRKSQQKELPLEALDNFRRGLEQMVGTDSTPKGSTARNDGATGSAVALNEGGKGSDGQKEVA